MQVAVAWRVAQGVQHKHGNVDIEFFTVFRHAKVAAVHGAGGCAQAGAAGVLKLLAGLEQGLMAHDAQAPDFFVHALGIVHVPCARDQLCGDASHVGDGDRVGKHVQPALWIRLVGQVLGMNFDLEFIALHGLILA